MRHDHRVQCLAILEIKEMGDNIVVRCKKDCRHGHGKKRQSFLYHRADFLMPGDVKVKITWTGIGVMSPEFAERRRVQQEAYRKRPPQKHGELTWDGHECQ